MKLRSPCVGKCRLKKNVCTDCKRTLEEIANWSKYSEQQKQAVIERLANLQKVKE